MMTKKLNPIFWGIQIDLIKEWACNMNDIGIYVQVIKIGFICEKWSKKGECECQTKCPGADFGPMKSP